MASLEAPRTVVEVYRTIESIIEGYGERRMKELLSSHAFSNEELHTVRGKAQATREIITALRNSLGYDHEAI